MTQALTVDSTVTTIDDFAPRYVRELLRCVDLLTPRLSLIVEAVRAATQRDRATVYFLGNGGSSAIARTLALAADSILGAGDHGTRWVGAWDPYRLSGVISDEGFESSGSRLLVRDDASARDLVVLISGSGNSRNLVAIAEHCTRVGVPLFSITGPSGGRLREYDPHGLRVDSGDQQIVEDTAHVLGSLLVRLVSVDGDPRLTIARHRAELVRALQPNISWLRNLSAKLANAALNGHRVTVLAPEGGGLGLSAEHVASNLRWDLRYQNKAARLQVCDGVSLCDNTGMNNDVSRPGVPDSWLLEGSGPGDVAVILAHDADSPAVMPSRSAAAQAGIAVFGWYGDVHRPQPNEKVWHVDSAPAVRPLLAQTTGHLLLRSVRAAVLESNVPVLHLVSTSGRSGSAWDAVSPQGQVS